MIDLKKAAVVLVFGVAAVAVAATTLPSAKQEQKEQPVVSCTAVQEDNKVTVRVKIAEKSPDGLTKVLASLNMLILDGGHGTGQVGNMEPKAKEGPANGGPTQVFSGIQVEVVKAIGQEHVIVLTTVLKNDNVVFAEAQNVKVSRQPAGLKDTATSHPATGPAKGSGAK